jgi:hypothetical protein
MVFSSQNGSQKMAGQLMASPCDAAAAALFSELVPRMEAIAEAQAAMAERLQRMDTQREVRAALDEQRAVVGRPHDPRQGLRLRGPVCALPNREVERLSGLPVCVKRTGQGALMAVRSAVVSFPLHMLRAVSEETLKGESARAACGLPRAAAG